MFLRRLFGAVALLAVFSLSALAAEPVKVADAADLFPPDTLFFAEFVKPAEITRSIAAFTQGTILEDMAPFMAKWREKHGDGYFPAREMIGMLGALAGPEALAEVARMQGAVIAVTGISKSNDPEVVGVLLPGQSNLPGLIMRILSIEGTLNHAGSVEGVAIIGDRPRVFNRVAPGGAPLAPQPLPPLEPPFIANMPGAIVIGSSFEGVGDVVKRIKGKEKRLALSGTDGFKSSAPQRQRPGLFLYANPARAAELAQAAANVKPLAYPPEIARAVNALINPKSIRCLFAGFSLAEGSFDLQLVARLVPGQTSPIFDLFESTKSMPPALRSAPRDTIAAVSMPLSNGEQHWLNLLAAADVIVGDDGPKPSAAVKELEGKLKASVGRDILGRIASISIAMPGKQELPKGAVAVPLLLIGGKDEAATEKLEQLVAPLLSSVAGDSFEPVTETIRGVKVRSVPGAKLPWRAPLHFGRRQTMLVLGGDRKLVAASLLAKVGEGLDSDPLTASALHDHRSGTAFGLWRWSSMLPEWLAEMSAQQTWVNGKRVGPDPSQVRNRVEKLTKNHAGLMQQIPPLVASLVREKDALVLTVRQKHTGETRAKLIEGMLDAIMGGATNLFDNVGAGAVAPPPPVKN